MEITIIRYKYSRVSVESIKRSVLNHHLSWLQAHGLACLVPASSVRTTRWDGTEGNSMIRSVLACAVRQRHAKPEDGQ